MFRDFATVNSEQRHMTREEMSQIPMKHECMIHRRFNLSSLADIKLILGVIQHIPTDDVSSAFIQVLGTLTVIGWIANVKDEIFLQNLKKLLLYRKHLFNAQQSLMGGHLRRMQFVIGPPHSIHLMHCEDSILFTSPHQWLFYNSTDLLDERLPTPAVSGWVLFSKTNSRQIFLPSIRPVSYCYVGLVVSAFIRWEQTDAAIDLVRALSLVCFPAAKAADVHKTPQSF